MSKVPTVDGIAEAAALQFPGHDGAHDRMVFRLGADWCAKQTAVLPTTSVSEPVAWMVKGESSPSTRTYTHHTERGALAIADDWRNAGWSAFVAPLYAHPAQSEPVSDGLVRFDGETMTPAAAANRLAESASALAAAEAKIDALEHRSLAEGRPTHRHKKRGSEYVLMGYGKMQAETWADEALRQPIGAVTVDMREVAIYRSATDPNELWVRPREEFEDGRFEPLPQPPEAK